MTSRDETPALRAEIQRLHAQARRDREALDWEQEQGRVLRRLVGRKCHELTQAQVENERLRHEIETLREQP